MSELAEKILTLLLNRYKETGSLAVEMEFPFEDREQRGSVTTELVNNGYIINPNIYGKTKLSCVLTEKLIKNRLR